MGYLWSAADAMTSERLNLTGEDFVTVEAGENLSLGDVVFVPFLNLRILEVTQDAHVLSTASGTNYGSEAKVVTGGAGGTYEAYIQFDLTDAPTSSEVIAAYLLLPWERQSDAGTGDLRRLTSSWDEGTVTYATKPTNTATNEVSITDAGSSNVGHKAYDITTLYGDIMDNTNYGFYLHTDGSTGSHGFQSKDSSEDHRRPLLVVWGIHPNAGKAYKITDPDAPTERLGYMGVVVKAATSGNDVIIAKSGRVTGLSGLTAGDRYFANSSGALSTTESAIPVGFALSTTEVLILPPSKLSVANVKLGATAGSGRTSRAEIPWIDVFDWALIQNNMNESGVSYVPAYWEVWFDRNDEAGETVRTDMVTLGSGILTVSEGDANETDFDASVTFFRPF